MVLLLVLVGAALLTRGLWLPQPPTGRLVEVVGDVPHPGMYAVERPLLSEALLAAGAELGEREDQVLLEGARIEVHGGEVRVERPEDPLLIGLPVDINLDGEVALAAMPGVGTSLARAIIAEREAGGPFQSLEELTRVRGVGAGLVSELRPYLSAELPDSAPVDLNRASAQQLRRLPGIGPALAQRIVADRDERGPFADVRDLERVRGIGPVTVAALAGRVTCGESP